MQVKRVQNAFPWVVLLSEVSHVFCCVLPTLFTVISLLVGAGAIGVMPLWLDSTHHLIHDWEIPIIIFSGVILLVGWGITYISRKLDCASDGCGHKHEPCAPKKLRSTRVLQIATVLFVMNVSIYAFVHMPSDKNVQHAHTEHEHEHKHK